MGRPSKLDDLSEKSQQKTATVASGMVMLPIGIIVLLGMMPHMLLLLTGRESMTLQQASEMAADQPVYALLTDGEWDCDSIELILSRFSTPIDEQVRYTEAFLIDESRTIVAFVSFEGRVDCNELEGERVSGYVDHASLELVGRLKDGRRLDHFADVQTVLEVCGYCGLSNSLIGILSGVGLIVLGGVFLSYGLKLKAET